MLTLRRGLVYLCSGFVPEMAIEEVVITAVAKVGFFGRAWNAIKGVFKAGESATETTLSTTRAGTLSANRAKGTKYKKDSAKLSKNTNDEKNYFSEHSCQSENTKIINKPFLPNVF